MVKADEALSLGLVDRVVPADEVYTQAHAWAAKLAQGPALALRAAKESIDAGLETDLETGLAIRTELVGEAVRDRGPRARHAQLGGGGAGEGEVPLIALQLTRRLIRCPPKGLFMPALREPSSLPCRGRLAIAVNWVVPAGRDGP